MDIKLNSEEQLIKQESFEEEIYSMGNDGQFPMQSGQEQSEVGQELEGMSEYSATSKPSKRARKYKSKAPSSTGHKVDIKAKLERSRQSARECRARKKLRYQYLEDLVGKRENNNIKLKKEIEQVLYNFCSQHFANLPFIWPLV